MARATAERTLVGDDGIDLSPDTYAVGTDTSSLPLPVSQFSILPSLRELAQEAGDGLDALAEKDQAPLPVEERAAVLAANTALGRDEIKNRNPMQRLTLQLSLLKEGGIFGDIDTEGANSLMMAVDLEEAGAWRSKERDVKRRLVERNPQVSVLPQYWVGKLRTPLAKARAALNDHSYRFPVTDAFIGPSFRFIPYTQWSDFIREYRQAQEELEQVKEELLVPEIFQEACDAVLQQAMARAEHAAKSLEANNTPVKDDFIPRFVERVQSRIPTMSAIRSRLKISFTPGILGDDADLADFEARNAEAAASLREAQIRLDTIAQTKAEMRLFVLDALKERLNTSLAPFDEMVRAFKAEAYRALVSVRECLTTEQHLDRTQARKLEHLFEELRKIKEFLGDDFDQEKLDNLVATATAFGNASASSQSPLLAGQLETTLADLQAICKDAADLAEGEDTGIGL